MINIHTPVYNLCTDNNDNGGQRNEDQQQQGAIHKNYDIWLQGF